MKIEVLIKWSLIINNIFKDKFGLLLDVFDPLILLNHGPLHNYVQYLIVVQILLLREGVKNMMGGGHLDLDFENLKKQKAKKTLQKPLNKLGQD